MKNYNKALQYYIEIEDDLSFFLGMDNYWLHITYSCIGESYNRTNNKERANYYYCKAYELLSYIECWDRFKSSAVLLYFKENKDYEKCEAILRMYSIWLEKSTDLSSKIEVFYWLYELYKEQNKWDEANICWEKAEMLLDIEKLSLMPKIQLRDIRGIFFTMTPAYIYDKYDFFKAEKILKIFESALDICIPSNAIYLSSLYERFIYLYLKENRHIEMNIYSQKLLNLLKLADQNDIWRENMNISKADIKDLIILLN